MQRVGLTTQRRKPKPRNRSKHSKPEPIDDSWALPCDVLATDDRSRHYNSSRLRIIYSDRGSTPEGMTMEDKAITRER